VRSLERLALRTRLVLSFVCAVVIATVISSAVTHVQWRKSFYAQVREEGTVLTQTLAQGSVDPILRNDFYALEEYVAALLKRENIAYVIVADRRDRILAGEDRVRLLPPEVLQRGSANLEPVLVQSFHSAALGADVEDIAVPVLIDGRKWGSVRVGFSLAMAERRIYANLPYALLSALLSATGGIAVALLLTRTITRPLAAITSSMRVISEGQLSQRIEIRSPDEFGQMAESFNRMAESLGQSQAQLERTYQELAQKQKMAALGELAARVAHEIKNPLGIIKGSAQILVDQKTTQPIKEEVGRFIAEETDRLNQKVMEILSYARPSVRELQPLDLNVLIERNRFLWESAAQRSGTILLTLRLAAGLPRIKGDGDLIVRALLNVVANACESIPADGTVVVETLRQEETWVVVRITDSGSGIDSRHLDRIFEPFFTTKPQGTGLGLSIVKGIVESHQGRVRVAPVEPHGTAVTLAFPALDAA
jgi:two-component system, NtrC family, sensor histidine kinase HydH